LFDEGKIDLVFIASSELLLNFIFLIPLKASHQHNGNLPVRIFSEQAKREINKRERGELSSILLDFGQKIREKLIFNLSYTCSRFSRFCSASHHRVAFQNFSSVIVDVVNNIFMLLLQT
jgi:hypothetical protein